MPFRDDRGALQDILEAIAKIESFVAGLDFDSYQESNLVSSAVERQLLIVAEAAKRLGDSAQELFPGPDWRSIRGLGNILRHEYDNIDSSRIWHVVRQGLPPLKHFVEYALRTMPAPDS